MLRDVDIVSGFFGPVDEARLIFNGRIEADTMTLQRNVEDEPDKKINYQGRTESNNTLVEAIVFFTFSSQRIIAHTTIIFYFQEQ